MIYLVRVWFRFIWFRIEIGGCTYMVMNIQMTLNVGKLFTIRVICQSSLSRRTPLNGINILICLQTYKACVISLDTLFCLFPFFYTQEIFIMSATNSKFQQQFFLNHYYTNFSFALHCDIDNNPAIFPSSMGCSVKTTSVQFKITGILPGLCASFFNLSMVSIFLQRKNINYGLQMKGFSDM